MSSPSLYFSEYNLHSHHCNDFQAFYIHIEVQLHLQCCIKRHVVRLFICLFINCQPIEFRVGLNSKHIEIFDMAFKNIFMFCRYFEIIQVKGEV